MNALLIFFEKVREFRSRVVKLELLRSGVGKQQIKSFLFQLPNNKTDPTFMLSKFFQFLPEQHEVVNYVTEKDATQGKDVKNVDDNASQHHGYFCLMKLLVVMFDNCNHVIENNDASSARHRCSLMTLCIVKSSLDLEVTGYCHVHGFY